MFANRVPGLGRLAMSIDAKLSLAVVTECSGLQYGGATQVGDRAVERGLDLGVRRFDLYAGVEKVRTVAIARGALSTEGPAAILRLVGAPDVEVVAPPVI